jgi:TRAP-type C4-dicarboxylate transport system permease small subunit
MDKLKKAGKILYSIYFGITVFSVAVMAACVIYAVIARYFFGISHTFLEEFITTVFAFSTFWGMGICFMRNEHVVIDTFYNMFPPVIRIITTFINYIVVLFVLFVMLKYGYLYAVKYGGQISMGMRVPMIWMYGIIPTGCGIAIICVLVKLVEYCNSLRNPAGKKEI